MTPYIDEADRWDSTQEEGKPVEYPLNQTACQPLPNLLYSYRKQRLSRENNTIKANCRCVSQPFYWRLRPGPVGVIDGRCSSCVSRWNYSGVDGQDEVSGFLLQVTHTSTGASASSFCSFIIFHPSQLKDDCLSPLLHHHQVPSSLANHWVSQGRHSPETAVRPVKYRQSYYNCRRRNGYFVQRWSGF